jgi:uncharacterized membrane protein YqhA
VAISTILLSKEFVQIGSADFGSLHRQVFIHPTFVVAGLIFAVTDYRGVEFLSLWESVAKRLWRFRENARVPMHTQL